MSIGLFFAIAAAVVAIAATVVAIVYWDDIVNWFRNRSRLVQEDEARIAFTLQERLKNGNYKTVQGIFDTDANAVVEGRAMESRKVDETLEACHADSALIVYES